MTLEELKVAMRKLQDAYNRDKTPDTSVTIFLTSNHWFSAALRAPPDAEPTSSLEKKFKRSWKGGKWVEELY